MKKSRPALSPLTHESQNRTVSLDPISAHVKEQTFECGPDEVLDECRNRQDADKTDVLTCYCSEGKHKIVLK